MLRIIFPVALLALVFSSCGSKEKEPGTDLNSPQNSVEDKAEVQAEDASVPSLVKPMPRKKLSIESVPYPSSKPGARLLKLPKGHYTERERVLTKDRELLVLARSPKKDTRAVDMLLYDPISESVVVELGWVSSVVVEIDVLVGQDLEDENILYRLSTNEVITPSVVLPGGGKPIKTMITAIKDSRDIWVIAVGEDKKVWYGLWADLENKQVKVNRPLPFFPGSWDESHGRIVVARPFSEPRTEGCESLLLTPDEDPVCADDRNSFDNSKILRPEQCEFDFKVGVEDPLKALFRCDESSTVYYGTSTGPILSFAMPPNTFGDRRGASIVSATQIITGSSLVDWPGWKTPSSHWIDTKNGVLYETEPMLPAMYNDELNSRFVGLQRNKNVIDAVVLDFDAQSASRVASYDDCKKDIPRHTQKSQADRDVLSCHSESYGGKHIWSEVLDHARHRRWRTRLAVEALLSDGTVLASNRTHEIGEQWRTFTKLYVLDLN